MFVTPHQATKYYGVTAETLRRWSNNGKIDFTVTDGGHRRYKIIFKNNIESDRKSYIYARVSSKKQEKDLERQIAFIKEKYPNHRVVTDIGS